MLRYVAVKVLVSVARTHDAGTQAAQHQGPVQHPFQDGQDDGVIDDLEEHRIQGGQVPHQQRRAPAVLVTGLAVRRSDAGQRLMKRVYLGRRQHLGQQGEAEGVDFCEGLFEGIHQSLPMVRLR